MLILFSFRAKNFGKKINTLPDYEQGVYFGVKSMILREIKQKNVSHFHFSDIALPTQRIE